MIFLPIHPDTFTSYSKMIQNLPCPLESMPCHQDLLNCTCMWSEYIYLIIQVTCLEYCKKIPTCEQSKFYTIVSFCLENRSAVRLKKNGRGDNISLDFPLNNDTPPKKNFSFILTEIGIFIGYSISYNTQYIENTFMLSHYLPIFNGDKISRFRLQILPQEEFHIQLTSSFMTSGTTVFLYSV